MMHRIERTFAGRPLRIECGRLAKQAAGSALIQFGDTVVLAAASVSNTISNLPFFPLLVEYREKFYAAGKIPGGFLKREARPHDEEILSARIIDRTVRPLFPEGFKNEVQVYVYVLSADQENDADVLGLTAASFALASSKIPFAGPVAAVRVGRVEGKWILNPTFQQLEFSDLDIVVSGSKDSIVMVEGGAAEAVDAPEARASHAEHGVALTVELDHAADDRAVCPDRLPRRSGAQRADAADTARARQRARARLCPQPHAVGARRAHGG